MRSVVSLLLGIVLLTGLPALAQRNPATVSSPRAVREVHQDFALEQAASTRTHRLAALLQPEAKAKLDLATRALLAQLASGPEDADPYSFAQQEVRSKFPQLSGEQSNLLSFYVLAEVARILSDPDELNGKLDGMNEMSDLLTSANDDGQKVEIHQHAQQYHEKDFYHAGHAGPKPQIVLRPNNYSLQRTLTDEL